MVQQIVDFLASLFADTETIFHPDAVILPDFTRSIQLDRFSCGAKSVYCILRYYDRQCTPESVERLLRTNSDGTTVSNIKRVFRRYHLNCRTLRKPGVRDLKTAINDDCPVLVSLYDSEHYAVVYGFSSSHIFVMNSSIDISDGGVDNLRCAVRKDRFRKVWDKWGLEVSE